MLGGKIKRPHYEACKFKGFEFVRTLGEIKRERKHQKAQPLPKKFTVSKFYGNFQKRQEIRLKERIYISLPLKKQKAPTARQRSRGIHYSDNAP